jgi:hypothetical protein
MAWFGRLWCKCLELTYLNIESVVWPMQRKLRSKIQARFAIGSKYSDFEPSLPDPMQEFDAGNDDRCIAKPYHREHWA